MSPTFCDVLTIGLLCSALPAVAPERAGAAWPDAAALTGPAPTEVDTMYRAQVVRPPLVAAPVAGDTTNTSGFFGTIKNGGQMCKAQKPMWSIGRLGIGAFPFPSYQEVYGWNLGAIGGLTLDQNPDGQSAASLGTMLSYEEREDRASGQVALSAWLLRRTDITSEVGVQYYDRLGRRGGGIHWSLGLLEPDDSEWLTAGAGIYRDRFVDMAQLGPTDWSLGQRTWGRADITLSQPRTSPILHPFRISLHGVLSIRGLGGDFSYRLATGRVIWPHQHWEVQTQWGNSSGHVPIQEMFDLGIDGHLGAVPIRRYRTTGFQVAGAEGRGRLLWDVFARPYATLVRGDGHSRGFAELGLGFTMGEDHKNYDPDDWIVRFDFPVYSSHGDHTGSREKWDLRRFMFRVNFPFPSPARDQEIRYRYPDR